ncbi:MAG: protein kinase, partial [Clostridia bacterium]|nr:protein kinase [Clostridia bacterium]
MDIINEGTILNDRYEVGRLIGAGGMSVVYEAKDIVLGIDVALKVLKSDFSRDAEQVERLQREASNVSNLHHPNIVKVYGLGHYEGCHYIAMEKIDGVTLDDLIAQGGALEWRDCVDIIRQVLAALCYTHSHGVIHKDIKPQNILVDEKKHVTLTDFGIAETSANTNTIVAADGACSVYYMSPEQARNGTVDVRSDIYSLGITFYEMLVGAVPFDGSTNYAIAMKHTNNNVIPACVVDESVPRAISDVVVVATMREVNKRFQTAEDMLQALNIAVKDPDQILVPAQYMVDNGIISEDSALAKAENAHKRVKKDPNKAENQAKAAAAAKTAKTGTGNGKNDGGERTVKEKKDKTAKVSSSGSGDVSAYEENPEEEEEDNRGRKRGRAGAVVLTAFVYVIAIFAAAGIIWFLINYYKDNKPQNNAGEIEKTYIVQNYEGYPASDIVKMLSDNGIACKIVRVESDIYPSGYVLTQNITEGTELTKGGTITLNVILEKDSEILTDYTGRSSRIARGALENLGLNVEEVEVPGTQGTGTVLKMKPSAGETVKKGDTVTLYVSMGNVGDYVVVPNLVGTADQPMTYSEAYQMVVNSGLKVGGMYPNPGEDISIYFATPTPTPTPTPEPTEEPAPEPAEEPGSRALSSKEVFDRCAPAVFFIETYDIVGDAYS